MPRSKKIDYFCAALLVMILALAGNSVVAGRALHFDGGPSGGVYTVFAEGLARLLAREAPAIQIRVAPSSGSVSNLLRLDTGQIDMAIAGGGDIVQGKLGKLESYPTMLEKVTAVTALYNEYGHLAVLASSPIHTVEDLDGARVAVGALGSGTLSAARRFFKSAGIWDRLKPQYASFDLAADDFLAGRVEALWQMSGYPSASLHNIAEKTQIRLIELGDAAARSQLYTDNPTYAPARIPAGSYPGIDSDVGTFSDQAVWVAARSVNADFIYRSLEELYSPKGIEFMLAVHPMARQLDPAEGRKVSGIEFHPGARRFWEAFETPPETGHLEP